MTRLDTLPVWVSFSCWWGAKKPDTVLSLQSWVRNQFTFFLLPFTALFGLPLLLLLGSVVVFSSLTMERGIYPCHLVWTQLCHFFAEIIFLWKKTKQKQHTRNLFEAYTIWICVHTCVSTVVTGHLILTHSLITIAFIFSWYFQ